MWKWLNAAQQIHALLAILAAVGCVRFLVRTRFWLPRYVHWLAGIALLIGAGMLQIVPADAPIYRGGWIGLKEALVVLLFPAIVYVAFVFYGGQRAAYVAQHSSAAPRCPYCGEPLALIADSCESCGQTIPPTENSRRP